MLFRSEMLSRYGSMPLPRLLEPSIRLAESGIIISRRQSDTMLEARADFLRFPSSRRYFLKENGDVYRDGEILVQNDLAKTLKILQKEGEKAFYKGEIAKAMVSQIRQNGGILSMKDLADYKVVWREPVRGEYRGYEIYSMPPPSSGGIDIFKTS